MHTKVKNAKWLLTLLVSEVEMCILSKATISMCLQLLSHCPNAVCRKAVCERTRWARGVTQKNTIKDGVELAMNEGGIMFHNNLMSDNTLWDGGMQIPSNNDADVCVNENCDVVNNTDNDVGKTLPTNLQCPKMVTVSTGGTQENKLQNIVQPTMDEDDDDTDDNDDDEKMRLLVKTK